MGRRIVKRIQRIRSKRDRVQKQSNAPATSNPLVELQRSIGSHAVQRLIDSPYVQTKLQVSTPGDQFEQEADQVANTVMRKTGVAQQPEERDEEKDKLVQKSSRAPADTDEIKETGVRKLPLPLGR